MPRQPYQNLPAFLFALAVCFLVVMLFTINEDVFFSGDGGLKYLMVKQIANGGDYAALQLESPLWVNKIWSQGFYPFKEPFVYDAPQGKIISFPPTFQWLSAYLYNWFGFRGLYIIPTSSVILLWILFITLLQRIKVKPPVISISFFLLVFCSPFTVYGALYWEHSVAVLLIFNAVVFLVLPQVSALSAALLGLLAGMSAWFRPEMLLLGLLFLVAVMFNYFKERNKTNVIFTVFLLAGMLSFFLFNIYLYGSILGAHSYQLLKPVGYKNFLIEKFIILSRINGKLVIFFPFVVFFGALTCYYFFKKIQMPRLVKQLTVITILFLLIVPFALPNAGGKQWGPRYFLFPIILVVTTLCLHYKDQPVISIDKKMRIILLTVVAYSLSLNTFLAYYTLKKDYASRVKSGLDFLKSQPCEVLVIQNQYMAQEYGALFETKKFFLAENQQSFNKLTELLKGEGVKQLIFMAHNNRLKMLPVNILNNSPELKKIGDFYFGEYDLK